MVREVVSITGRISQSGFEMREPWPFGVEIDCAKRLNQNVRVTISLSEPMQRFVRRNVAGGEYGTPSEVVREALRLLRRRDKVWRNEMDRKIKAGMESIRAGRTISAERTQAEMASFKKKWAKARPAK